MDKMKLFVSMAHDNDGSEYPDHYVVASSVEEAIEILKSHSIKPDTFFGKWSIKEKSCFMGKPTN